MPDAAEVDGLVRQLAHGDDLGEALDALDERILDGLADAAREREEAFRRELLVAEEHDEVLEPRGADRGDDVVVELRREVDARDLRAERARDRNDRDRARPAVHQSIVDAVTPP